jgi:hypothetical protein
MSSHLEKFVQDHREQLDDESPSPELWDRIRDGMKSTETTKQEEKKETPVRSLPFRRWLSAAAAVVLVCVSGWLYFALRPKTVPPPVAINKQSQAADTQQAAAAKPTEHGDTPDLAQTSPAEPKKPEMGKGGLPVSQEEADYNEEIYHYSRLVEIKHNELKTLQKDEPLLYKKFSADVNKLDSVYRALKTQLPQNSNREQLIEAMISNLQLQIGLLNKQLDIIKQIKHSKKSAYEKAYKSV